MKRWLNKLTAEEYFLVAFGLSFLVGVWYAFPMVNNVTDVWAFGGGVLRTLEAHSLLPVGGDLAYGTVSFYQNYLAMAIALALSYVFNGFDLATVKTALILNPHYSLLVPRIVSALTAMFLLFVVYRFFKLNIRDIWWRLALIMLLFGNVITIFITRSGKMWMLSVTLIIISFIFLYLSITKERGRGLPGRYALISLVATALATANFAFAGLFFIAVPILFFAFPKTSASIKRLLYIALVSVGVVLVFFLLNAENIIEQVSGFLPDFLRPSNVPVALPKEGTLTILETFRLKMRHAFEAFPLILLAIIPAFLAGIRDRTLAFLAILYGGLYMTALVSVFQTDQSIALNVRHVFPFGVFLVFFLAACNPPRKFWSGLLLLVSASFYIYTVYLLSVPTTYNDAYSYIEEHYGNQTVYIEENIFEFTLPMNKASYELFIDSACASTCRYRLSLDTDITFKPIVITNESDQLKTIDLQPDLIVTEKKIPECTHIARFGNLIPDDQIFDIDINLGRILMPSFYKLKQLGKNLYLYDTMACEQKIYESILHS